MWKLTPSPLFPLREKREAEEEAKRIEKKVKEKTITIEEIEEQRAKINGTTKVTLETFNEWKKKQVKCIIDS